MAAAAAAAGLAWPRPAAAQPEATSPGAARPDAFCWRGRPLPRCRAFALFELGLYGGLATTRLRESDPARPELPARDEAAFTSQLSWSAGAMRNRDASTALGGALVVAIADNGNVVAGTARWRRWTGRRTSVELAAGPGAAQAPLPAFRRAPVGVATTGDGGVGWRPAVFAEARANAADLAALAVRGVFVPRAGGRTQAGVHAGASVGSGLAAAGSVGIAAVAILLIATFARAAY